MRRLLLLVMLFIALASVDAECEDKKGPSKCLAKAKKGKCLKKKKLRKKKCCATCSLPQYSVRSDYIITTSASCTSCSYRGFANDAAGDAATYTGVCASKDGATSLCSPLQGNPGFPDACEASYGAGWALCTKLSPPSTPPRRPRPRRRCRPRPRHSRIRRRRRRRRRSRRAHPHRRVSRLRSSRPLLIRRMLSWQQRSPTPDDRLRTPLRCVGAVPHWGNALAPPCCCPLRLRSVPFGRAISRLRCRAFDDNDMEQHACSGRRCLVACVYYVECCGCGPCDVVLVLALGNALSKINPRQHTPRKRAAS